MKSFLGWLIFCVLLCLPGMLLLWPLRVLVRRRNPGAGSPVWIYLAASAASGLLLWYVIPPAVHWAFSRPVP